MFDKIKNNQEKIKKIIENILIGSFISSFKFDTSFTLKFSREFDSEFENEKLPKEVEIILLSEWWFGNKNEWEKKIKLLAPKNAVEPCEPVQAYELANLRWMDGNIVKSIKFDNNICNIRFENDVNILIDMKTDFDYSFVIQNIFSLGETIDLNIKCEDGIFFI